MPRPDASLVQPVPCSTTVISMDYTAMVKARIDRSMATTFKFIITRDAIKQNESEPEKINQSGYQVFCIHFESYILQNTSPKLKLR